VLAYPTVDLDVAIVVHDQDRGREHADHHARDRCAPAQPGGLEVVGPADRDDTEEHENEELAETGIGDRPRPARVRDPGRDRCEPDDEDRPPAAPGEITSD